MLPSLIQCHYFVPVGLGRLVGRERPAPFWYYVWRSVSFAWCPFLQEVVGVVCLMAGTNNIIEKQQHILLHIVKRSIMALATEASIPTTLYTKTRSILRRLDHVESCLSSRVARHRRRATNILDVTSSTRRTHVRYVILLFITYC